MRTPLTEDLIEARLTELPGWRRKGATIERTWQFADFDAAMQFVNATADIARSLDHHADLYNVYDRVRIALTTHDADGLTELDFEFARRADALTPA